MTTLAVTSVNSLLCHDSICFRIGSKLRCIRSTPTEMQSISENDFECLASTGVKCPANAMFEHIKNRRSKFSIRCSWQTRVVQPDTAPTQRFTSTLNRNHVGRAQLALARSDCGSPASSHPGFGLNGELP